MILKVCGMREPGNIKDLLRIKPNWVGLIFYRESPRWVQGNIPLSPAVKRVGVFVDPDKEELIEIAKKYELDLLQLHGGESPDFCRELRLLGHQIIKSFSLYDEFDFSTLEAYDFCDYFLFDTLGALPGGNGLPFNWELLRAYRGNTPFLLSGGIGPESIERINNFSHSRWIGVDVNSRFETAPGIKDIRKIKEFKDALFGK